MVELSFNLPTVVVWLKQAILSIMLFLKYFKMTKCAALFTKSR